MGKIINSSREAVYKNDFALNDSAKKCACTGFLAVCRPAQVSQRSEALRIPGRFFVFQTLQNI